MDTQAGNIAGQAAQESGVDIFACYQCEKCTNGCPVTFAMDFPPHAVIRMAQMGFLEELENARTPWVCSACETCRTRCPNQIDIPRFMDWLKRASLAKGNKPADTRVHAFHAAFLDNIARYGRVQESALMGSFMARALLGGQGPGPGDLWENAKLGIKMLARRRLSLVPRKASGKERINKYFSRG